MFVVHWLVKGIEAYALSTARIGQVAIIVMFPLITLDVFMRTVFNSPIPGTFELIMAFNVVAMSMTLAYVQVVKEHISVDVLFKHFPPRLQYAANVLIYLLGLVFFGLLAQQFVIAFRDSWAVKHTFSGIINVPIYPLHFLLLLGSSSICLVLVVDIVRNFRNLLRPPPLAEKQAAGELL